MRSQSWRLEQVECEKRDIKQTLDAIASPSERLEHALANIHALADDISSRGLLRRFVFCMSALVHHDRYGGLTDVVATRILEIVRAILDAKQIDPRRSKLRFLIGEYYLARSQFFRKSGEHWLSAWDQQMAARHIASHDAARQVLAEGLRFARVGAGRLAVEALTESLKLQLPTRQHIRALLALAAMERVRQEYTAARNCIATLRTVEGLEEREQLELVWEEICLDAQATGNLKSLVRAVQPGESHHTAAYYLEAFLWTRATDASAWQNALPKVSSKARPRSLGANQLGFFFRAAAAIEYCHDLEVPFELRLRHLGETLADRKALVTIDKELLFLAAAAFWLRRNHAFGQARFVLNEYEAHSLRLTDGRSTDSLSLLSPAPSSTL